MAHGTGRELAVRTLEEAIQGEAPCLSEGMPRTAVNKVPYAFDHWALQKKTKAKERCALLESDGGT